MHSEIITLGFGGFILACACWGIWRLRISFANLHRERSFLSSARNDFQAIERLEGVDLNQWEGRGIISDWVRLCHRRAWARLETPPEILEDRMVLTLASDDSRLRTLITSLVVLGLLGTFLGMVINVHTVSELVETAKITFSGGPPPITQFQKLLDQIQGPLSGMSIAFTTSILGLGFSLVLGFVFATLLRQRALYYREMMAFANETLIPFFAPRPVELRIEDSVEAIQKNLEESLKTFYQEHFSLLSLQQKQAEDALAEAHKKNAELMGGIVQKINSWTTHSQTGYQKLVDHLDTISRDILKNLHEIAASFQRDLSSDTKVVNSLHEGSKNILKAANEFNRHISNFVQLSQPLEKLISRTDEFVGAMEAVILNLQKMNPSDSAQLQVFQNIHTVMTGNNHKLESLFKIIQELCASFHQFFDTRYPQEMSNKEKIQQDYLYSMNVLCRTIQEGQQIEQQTLAEIISTIGSVSIDYPKEASDGRRIQQDHLLALNTLHQSIQKGQQIEQQILSAIHRELREISENFSQMNRVASHSAYQSRRPTQEQHFPPMGALSGQEPPPEDHRPNRSKPAGRPDPPSISRWRRFRSWLRDRGRAEEKSQ